MKANLRRAIVLILALVMSLSIFSGCDSADTGTDTGKYYLVTFSLNGASGIIKAQRVREGGLVTRPTAPSREEYQFLGWFDDSGAEWNFDTMKVTKNMILTAKWLDLAAYWDVTFDVGEATGTVRTQNVRNNGFAFEPTAPARPGFNFGGWYNGATKWVFEEMPITQNITLTALWNERNADYEATMDWSQDGFVYFHYRRVTNTEEDYRKWVIWAWPAQGGGRMYEFERFDDSGAVAAIDVSQVYHDGGVEGDMTVDYRAAPSMGYLVVLKSSMGVAGSHWQSECGDTFVTNIWDNVRENGSVHIFVNQGEAYNYKFSYSDEEIVDPYADLEPGEAVSVSNVDSSSTTYYRADTSQEFLDNVGVGYTIQVASYADSNGDGMGDIRGIINSLDYLADDLKVNVLWLTPIQLSESYHGYDTTDYYQIDPKFGTIEDYRELLYRAHAKGVRILMDLVINHTSLNHEWFRRSAKLEPEYRNFYTWKYNNNQAKWYQYGTTNYWYFGSFGSSMPELNYDNQATRDAFIDVANYWLSFGVDGFRIDAVKHVYMLGEYTGDDTGDKILYQAGYDRNVTKNVNFFREFNARIKANYPDAFLVGENFDGEYQNLVDYYAGMDSQFDFDTYYSLPNVFDANSANTFAQKHATMLAAFDIERGGTRAINSTVTANHDEARLVNRVYGGGSLTSGQLADATTKGKLIAATLMTLPGVSWIYYGDELGMTGSKSDDPKGAGADHADRWFRQPFKWDTTKTAKTTGYTFEGGFVVEWNSTNQTLAGVTQQLASSSSTLAHFQKFTALKSTDPVLIRGTYTPIVTTNKNIFAFTRSYNGVTYYVYHNFSGSAISGFATAGAGTSAVVSINGATATNLPAYGSIVLRAA